MSSMSRHRQFGAVATAVVLGTAVVPAAAVVLAAACAGEGGPDESGEPDSMGASPGLRPWAAGPWVETEIEATSGDDVFLSAVWDVGVDSRGRVYVIDFGEDGIIVLNPDLTHDRTIGREGEGPGEFLYRSRVQLLPGDSLVVWDSRLQRSTVFAAGSDEPAYDHSPATPERIDAAWRLPGSTRYIARSSPFFTPDASDEGRTQVLRFVREESGRLLDEVFAEYPDNEGLVYRSPGRVMVGPHPFGRQSFVEINARESTVLASSDAVGARIIDFRGQVESAFAWETAPIRVTAEELDRAVDEAMDPLDGVLRDGAPYVWPAVTGLAVDDEDRIWLGIRKPDRSFVEWAAFMEDGAHLQSVDLPAGFEVHAVRGGRIIGVARDELEVPRVIAYRLR